MSNLKNHDSVIRDMDNVREFYQFAVERYNIYLRRKRGEPWPWTPYMELRYYSFCNVFREDDRTTIWFRENIREPLRDSMNVLMATVAFRWFNRIETGELVKEVLLSGWDRKEFEKRLQGVKPVITGAYMICSPPGKSKLEGLCDCIDNVYEKESDLISLMSQKFCTLQTAWGELIKFNMLGNFMSYEVVTDLRHTFLLENAPDTTTWASPGPGATRGIGRVIDGSIKGYRCRQDIEHQKPEVNMLMQHILDYVNSRWPKEWPEWEMREVEHTLCEYDKFKRLQSGEGQVKKKFIPPHLRKPKKKGKKK